MARRSDAEIRFPASRVISIETLGVPSPLPRYRGSVVYIISPSYK